MARLEHPRAIRWMHWINFPLLAVMIWSGLRIYWADLRGYHTLDLALVEFTFFPQWFFEWFGLERRLARGMAFHFTFGWFFAINGLLYAVYLARSGEWRHLVPGRTALRDAGRVIAYDLGIGRRRGRPEQGLYNAAQQLAYSAVLVFGVVVVLTGLAIYKPTQLAWLTGAFGGYESARLIHFGVTIGFLLFFVVHVLQVARAGWRTFAAMVTGYRVVEVSAEPEPEEVNHER